MEPLKQNKINILDNDEKINEIIINLDNYDGNKCEIVDKCYEKEYKSDGKFFL